MTGPLSILAVSNDAPELHSLRKAFQNHGVSFRHLLPEDASELQAYFQKGPAAGMFVPTLLMLDCNACEPADIIALLKKHPVLRLIPVVVYGWGNDPELVKQAYQWGAVCYLPKPRNWEESMASFCSLWNKRVALPTIDVKDLLRLNSFFSQN